MINKNIYRSLRNLAMISTLGFSGARADMVLSPKPPEPLPPRLGEACVNDDDAFIPGFDPTKDEVRRNEDWDVAVFDNDGKQESPWYDVDTENSEVCVDDDETLALSYGIVAIGKNGGHGLMPITFTYGRDGVTVSRGPVVPDTDTGWKSK